jgi:hypothetical protein
MDLFYMTNFFVSDLIIERMKRDPANPSACEKECKAKHKHKAYYQCVVDECHYNPVWYIWYADFNFMENKMNGGINDKNSE